MTDYSKIIKIQEQIDQEEQILEELKNQLSGIATQYYQSVEKMQSLANGTTIYMENAASFIDWIIENSGDIDEKYEDENDWDSIGCWYSSQDC